MRYLPNLLTCLRLALTPPMLWLMLREQYLETFWLFLLAGVTDALDGQLARRFGWTSRLGAWLDPLADKALLVGSYLCLALSGLVPVWLAMLVILRDAVILVGAGAFRLLTGALTVRPSWLGKASTLGQITLVVALLLEAAGWSGLHVMNTVLTALVALLALASGADYVWQWTAHYRRHKACH